MHYGGNTYYMITKRFSVTQFLSVNKVALWCKTVVWVQEGRLGFGSYRRFIKFIFTFYFAIQEKNVKSNVQFKMTQESMVKGYNQYKALELEGNVCLKHNNREYTMTAKYESSSSTNNKENWQSCNKQEFK